MMKDTSKLWDKRYQELLLYKKQKGDTNVPRRYEQNPSLGVWVSNQRQYYKKFKTGISGWGMTESRIKRLESIGFEWVLAGGRANVGCHNNNAITGASASDNSISGATSEWDKMYDRLVAYKHLHGNVNVPKNHEDDQNLADWVAVQKHEFKNFGAETGMTYDRFSLLLDIQFRSCINDDGEDGKKDELISDVEVALDKSTNRVDHEGEMNNSQGETQCRTIPFKEGITFSSFGTNTNKPSFDNHSGRVNEKNDEEEDKIFFEAVSASGNDATLDSVAEIVFRKFTKKNNSKS